MSIKFTANFEANLEAIEAFYIDADAAQAYDRLLGELGDTILPNLEQFPRMGRPFLVLPPDSVEAASKLKQLRAQLARLGEDGDVREYVTEHYLILYALVNEIVYLLSIRHHKQLSFDFAHFWKDSLGGTRHQQ